MEDYPRTVMELERRFSTKEACRKYLAALRWPEGFRCRVGTGVREIPLSYLYDALGRLTQTTYSDLPSGASAAEGGRVVKWTYDAVGNRLTQDDAGSVTTYTYNAANQIQTMISPSGFQTSFGFDGNGNMLWKSEPFGLTQYTWDFENRLREVASPSGTTTFGYDANGIRVFKESGGIRTDYLIDTVSVLVEYEAGVRKSAYVLGSRIDEIISQTNDQGKFWYLADALGSVTALTDTVGRVIKTYRYDAWGEDAGVTGPGLRNPYRWTGREWDPTGLQYNRARYVGTAGAFVSRDRVSEKKGSSWRYVLSGANPVNNIDPLGLFWIEPDESYSAVYGIFGWIHAIIASVGAHLEFSVEFSVGGSYYGDRQISYPDASAWLWPQKANLKLDCTTYPADGGYFDPSDPWYLFSSE